MSGDQDSNIMHKNFSGGAQPGADGQWHETYVGGTDINDSGVHEGWPYSSDDELSWSDTDPAGLEIYTIGGVLNYAGPIIWNDDVTYLYYFAAVSIPDQDQVWGCASCGPGYETAWMTHYRAKNVHYSWPTPYDQGDITLGAVTHVRLYTGGKAQIKRQNLFCINAWADEYFKAPYYGWWLTQSQSVDKVSLTVLGKHPGADGNLWIVLPDNSPQDITVHAPKQHYNAWASPTKYLSQFDVFVRQPYPQFPYDVWNIDLPLYPVYDLASHDAGHVWWKLISDASVDVINKFTTPDCSQWLNTEVGYAYITASFISYVPPVKQGPGTIDTNNAVTGPANIVKEYAIGFQGPRLIDGLNYTESISNSPGTWNSSTNNCVQETVKTGTSVGVQLPQGVNDWYPEYFGIHLPPSDP